LAGDEKIALPVTIAGPQPVPVVVVAPLPAPPIQKQQDQTVDPSIAAKTTFQEDLTTAGQRQVNLIWERTQAAIAIMVVVSAMVSGVVAMMYTREIPTILSVAFGMVTGFYFSRTNHAAIGGVGRKPTDSEYTGR
jgi:hypothetical protein